MRFAIFPPRLSKVFRLPRKIEDRSYELPRLSRKIILANLPIWCSKMPPYSGNQRPDLLTSLMDMSFVLRVPREMHLWRSSSNVPCLPSFLDMWQNPHVLLSFDQVHHFFSRLPRGSTSERPKVLRTPRLFHFWLGNVLRATTACTFSTCCAFNVLTWKCASRHNGVQLFISHLASWLRTRRFGEPICRPSRATNHWKNSNFFPSLLWFSLLCSSLLSDSAHLCFSSVHIVGSFTSKFPSVMNLLFNIFDAPFTTSKK